ncbi:MAG: transglutaminase family protein [Thiofilum sp.]|uniref:transglutaminase family protein n=1 Tax=Thiofilum sp. TaxID=2212733 RepID=UPI0025E28636|nr:transglutaminase family protein [Thiofilum sp.]MBK8454459.1 transglutaminase family protein [Thiofilum sp.]
MSIHVTLNHRTVYHFDHFVNLSPHIIRLRPAPHTRTPILAYSLTVKPENHFINWQQDPFGNWLARLVINERAKELSVEVNLTADLVEVNPFDFFVEEYAQHYPFKYDAELAKELIPYLEIREDGEQLKKWLKGIDFNQTNTILFLVALNHRLQQDINYNIRMEPGVQSCEQTLSLRTGSCRDSAWLLVQILRHLGLAARFVSGYLVQLTPDVKALDGPSGPKEDFTDLHAWTEVYLPGAGWVGLDPTSGLFASTGHIPLACTPSPSSAAAIHGFTDICESTMEYSNTVKRIHEDPRVTKPYTDAQWTDIMALGHQVEASLVAQDVRLTMGGEPTFVSVDDVDSPQWNQAALGEHKRERAGVLFRRMQQAFSKGSLLHFGQGKWYPGEPFPRWALACYWRTDGLPLWNNPQLIADDNKDYGYGLEDAQRFAYLLCENLGLSTEFLVPGYEDRLYYLWKEASQPINVDWLGLDLKNSEYRNDLVLALQRGLNTPNGYALPLRWNAMEQNWDSAPWYFRREAMYLIPGNSPMGLRLPLDSLHYTPQHEREVEAHSDPFEDKNALPAHTNTKPHKPYPKEYYGEIIRTALCVEARHGRMHVFLPPFNSLDQYVELISALETTAEQLNMPLMIEGYEPPHDPRLKSFKVTPDPGVIEVNIHPASAWDELVHNTETLYEEARLSRLVAEKFMLDGRHTGTGGGNHVTLGAARPIDSPFLRRPDLLRSLITYWQNHPGLSYLFSGTFIGPTSQAPRVDEARDSSLYELEIAFQHMPTGEVNQPWLVDRLLRNLLTDITGNTHRAEFCIDKLYSPDSYSGRQGLLELRAFEMPPHAHMSLVQMLLLRTLVAHFWKTPYQKKLVRWGTDLHNRFMLPHFVWEDMRDVCDELQAAGFPFQLDWLKPFHEFRFPVFGRVQYRGMEIELRAALEPWNVLGEEMSSSGTARFVDSSMERIQVKVSGIRDERYVLVCNGRRVPLQNTGVQGEYVAGVKFRAWQPPSALHPTIPVQSPLVFDLVDTWNGRSIGGCTYHVVHAGGRSYETFPINAYEAEGRRFSRFQMTTNTPDVIEAKPLSEGTRQFYTNGVVKPMEPPKEEINPDFPNTLDLRRV